MIKGINNSPYLKLDNFLDIKSFKDIHPEIARGMALAREYAKEGTWMKPGFEWSDASYIVNWKPIYQAFEEYQQLPDNDPIKIAGSEIFPTDFKDYKQRNVFTRYLKTVLGANDPYVYYFLWEEGDWNYRNAKREPTEESKFFPRLVDWVYNLIDNDIISQIGRVIIFHCDHNGKAFEHRDLDAKNGKFENNFYTDHKNEFIHIRPRTKRGFYIWDPEEENKYYLNCHAAFWNDQDWHGGESSVEQEYGVRIDCVFTDNFRKKIGIDAIDSY